MNCIQLTRKNTWFVKFFVMVAFMATGFGGCGGEDAEETNLNVLPFLTSDDDGHTHVVYLPYADVYGGPKVGGVILKSSNEQGHTHDVQVRQDELLILISGGQVVRPTSHTLGHQHHVLLSLGPVKTDAGDEPPLSDAGVPDAGLAPDSGAPDADPTDTEVDPEPEPVSGERID